jgi:hypothetical protein
MLGGHCPPSPFNVGIQAFDQIQLSININDWWAVPILQILANLNKQSRIGARSRQ